jgi:hypothetical protein
MGQEFGGTGILNLNRDMLDGFLATQPGSCCSLSSVDDAPFAEEIRSGTINLLTSPHRFPRLCCSSRPFLYVSILAPPSAHGHPVLR